MAGTHESLAEDQSLECDLCGECYHGSAAATYLIEVWTKDEEGLHFCTGKCVREGIKELKEKGRYQEDSLI